MDEQSGFRYGEVGAAVPDGLPVLSAGRHRGPERGSCVMEYVSVLAGQPWSDHPRCTDRALAALARMVNDGVRADARPALAALAPRLVGAVGPGTATEVVVAAVARAGLQDAPGDPVLGRLARRAGGRATGPVARLLRIGRALGEAGVGNAYLQVGRTLRERPRAERDAARIRALALAIEDVRRHVGAPEEPLPGAASAPAAMPVPSTR